ncbi:hypothetical protein [Dyadobacter sp. MSC1_007]|jgi:hypothetical protein|uniref:hypothetical protein n=1 Tax=Dyadobacter sp. MSC1_007 TaxID=2909264 RepID=UPI00202DFD38|nr:hypothetical protein [Dyadobacter sp. MSC1_007]
MESKIEIYRSPDGEASIDVVFEEDTVWLTNSQLVTLSGSSKANTSEHGKHIFLSDELDKVGTVRKFRTVQQDGARLVERDRIILAPLKPCSSSPEPKDPAVLQRMGLDSLPQIIILGVLVLWSARLSIYGDSNDRSADVAGINPKLCVILPVTTEATVFE